MRAAQPGEFQGFSPIPRGTNPPSIEDMETSPPAVDPRDLRVSDQEREHVVGVLQHAIGLGLIDLDEFTERTDIAYAATTRGQLNVVLSDLTGLVHRDAPYRTGPQSAPRPTTFDPRQRLELVGHYSNVTREGRWPVPEHILVRNKYGTTRLDFTDAEFSTGTVYVELDTRWGSVHVLIPQGAAIDLNGIREVRHGSVEDRTGTNGSPGHPRIMLSGRVHGGNLQVKYRRGGMFGPASPGRRHRCGP